MSDGNLATATRLRSMEDPIPLPIDLFRDDQVGWTKKIMGKLKGLKQKSWDYTWIHRENSGYLNDVYDWLSVGCFVLSFLNGGILLFRTNFIYIQVFTIVLSFGTGLLQFFIKFKNYPELIEKHKMASSRFSAIYNNIERQLSLPVNMRQNPLHFHTWISQQFDTLFATAPDIDGPVIDKYRDNLAKVENGKRRHSYAMEADRFDISNDSSSSQTDLKPHTLNSVKDSDMDSISSDIDTFTSDFSDSETIQSESGSISESKSNNKEKVKTVTDNLDKDSDKNEDSDKDENKDKEIAKHNDSDRDRDRYDGIGLKRKESLYENSSSRRGSQKKEKDENELARARSRKSLKKKKKLHDKYLTYQMGRFDANLMYQDNLNYNLNNKCLMDDVVFSGIR
jgi:hypothetical protein